MSDISGDVVGGRIKELEDKSRAASLTAAEKLELRQLRLRQKQVRLSRQAAELAETRRKLDTRRKIELGGLLLKAGLGDWDTATLLGGLMALSRTTKPETLAAWRDTGGSALATPKPEADGDALHVAFVTRPPAGITKALRGKGFRWNREAERWEGRGQIEDITAMVASAGGKVMPAAPA